MAELGSRCPDRRTWRGCMRSCPTKRQRTHGVEGQRGREDRTSMSSMRIPQPGSLGDPMSRTPCLKDPSLCVFFGRPPFRNAGESFKPKHSSPSAPQPASRCLGCHYLTKSHRAGARVIPRRFLELWFQPTPAAKIGA